jgi:hypothetical protein
MRGDLRIIAGMHKMIAFLELRTLGGVTLSVSDTEVLSNEGSVAIWEVTSIDLLRGI